MSGALRLLPWFELFAHLEETLMEQETVDELLRKEHAGFYSVTEEETIKHVFRQLQIQLDVARDLSLAEEINNSQDD